VRYEDWVAHMRVGIMSASIAHECHDKMRRGWGAPDEDDMRRFAEDAGALADLWQDSITRAAEEEKTK
jgi:hypothetical protein